MIPTTFLCRDSSQGSRLYSTGKQLIVWCCSDTAGYTFPAWFLSKASANKKKFQKVRVARAAKVYGEQLRKEVAEECRKLGKKGKDDENRFIDPRICMTTLQGLRHRLPLMRKYVFRRRFAE